MGEEELLFAGPPTLFRSGEHGSHAGGHLEGDQDQDEKPEFDAGQAPKEGVAAQFVDVASGKADGDEPDQEGEQGHEGNAFRRDGEKPGHGREADEDEAGTRKKNAAETIKRELAARNASTLVVGNHKVELASVAGRTTVDWKAAEKAGIDLDPYKKTGQPSERLTVS